MSGRDVIVIGAGHNGLAAASLLRRHGRRVLVLESRDTVGGIASAETFHPGYRSAGLLHDTQSLRPEAIRALRLEDHGLRLRPRPADTLALEPDGGSWLLPGDPGRATKAIAAHSVADARGWESFHAFVDRVRPVIDDWLDRPPLDPVRIDANPVGELLRRGLRLRSLGRKQMIELLRVPPMPVVDWLDEWFSWPSLKALLAWPAVASTFAGPRSPGTAANLLLDTCAAGAEVEGGPWRVAEALERSAREVGVEIRTGCPVERIDVEGETVHGVTLAGGETLSAAHVVASCSPTHTFLELLGPGRITPTLTARLRAWRSRGTTAQVLLAVAGPVRFRGQEDTPIEHARTAGHPDLLEQAFDAAKYRRISSAPILDVRIPTVACPELAPEGHSVVSVLVQHAPDDLKGGWTDETRQRLADTVVTALEAHAPGLTEAVVACCTHSPADLAKLYGLPGGHLFHGEHALDQLLVRPTPECSGYGTPIDGLWVTGGGTHPGGGISAAPGLLAARAVLAS